MFKNLKLSPLISYLFLVYCFLYSAYTFHFSLFIISNYEILSDRYFSRVKDIAYSKTLWLINHRQGSSTKFTAIVDLKYSTPMVSIKSSTVSTSIRNVRNYWKWYRWKRSNSSQMIFCKKFLFWSCFAVKLENIKIFIRNSWILFILIAVR